ncbi:MAG: hypothetical protein E7337_15325 [Clostridiales bacterium]|nr:hypothetical protein [Clostridiales bacterium]
MANHEVESVIEIREDVALVILLNRARYLSRLVDCYFNLTVSDKDSDLARKIASRNSEVVDCLDKAMRLITSE